MVSCLLFWKFLLTLNLILMKLFKFTHARICLQCGMHIKMLLVERNHLHSFYLFFQLLQLQTDIVKDNTKFFRIFQIIYPKCLIFYTKGTNKETQDWVGAFMPFFLCLRPLSQFHYQHFLHPE